MLRRKYRKAKISDYSVKKAFKYCSISKKKMIFEKKQPNRLNEFRRTYKRTKETLDAEMKKGNRVVFTDATLYYWETI